MRGAEQQGRRPATQYPAAVLYNWLTVGKNWVESGLETRFARWFLKWPIQATILWIEFGLANEAIARTVNSVQENAWSIGTALFWIFLAWPAITFVVCHAVRMFCTTSATILREIAEFQIAEIDRRAAELEERLT